MSTLKIHKIKSPSNEDHRSSTVNIQDYSHNHINPSPIPIPKDSDLLEEFLSPRKLQALTGVEDLQTVEYLEMRVNTEQMSLGNFGMYLPNLSQIKLSGSYITSVRDLGTSLWNLQVLWMPQCQLQCLDGLGAMSSINELYLAYNGIEDISACAMLENMEILDLEGNLITDVTMMYYLSMCPSLSRLTLQGNPFCNPCNYIEPETYRKKMFEIISHLQFLDDLSPNFEENVTGGDIVEIPEDVRDLSNATLEFQDHWTFINTVLKEAGLLAECTTNNKQDSFNQSPDDSGRPCSSVCTNSSRPNTSLRPFSAQRSTMTSAVVRPLSSSASQGCDSAKTVDSGNDTEEQHEDSSMTAGRIVCGNITKSLRRKSTEKTMLESPKDKILADILSPRKPLTKSTIMKGTSVEESCDLILKELQEWRLDYQRTKTRIEKQRGPQVLTIEYSDEDIEQVDMANQMNSPKKKLEESNKLKNKSQIKLNPVRNGKQIVTRNQKVVEGPMTSTSSQNPPPMSRIRKQLLQSGLSSTMPSKPIFRK